MALAVGRNLARQLPPPPTPISFSDTLDTNHQMATTDDYLDSLPYYDDDLQKFPYLRQKVDQELARELKKMNQGELHPKVPPPVELFTVREHSSA